ncbi:MAG TPA: tetratricopeptide repeat protein [Candidatus Saccharimonadales bacterium]|nr:tetratricopeptide repeat protein [Candidatus Saccharimonadales bacterium]
MRLRLFAAAAMLLLFASAAFSQKVATQSGGAKEAPAITRAESAMDQQQWPEAESILRRLVAANSKDARAWFDLGYVMHAQKNYPEAIAAYRGAVAAQPTSFECNLNLGMMLAHENEPDASKYLEAATHLKPTGEHAQRSLSRAWAALAQVQTANAPKQALDSWSHAVALTPDDTESRLAFGEALEKAGDRAGAEREFRKANELSPDSTDALAALSNLFMRSERLPDAEEMLRKLVGKSPQDESGHLQLGRVLSAQKKDAEAAAELQKAVELRPNDWDAVRELAFVQERDKQFAAAESNYRVLLAHFPNDAEVHNGLGSVLLRQLKYAEAQNEFLTCIRLKPDWGEAYGQLALAASGNKDYQLAIKALDERKKRIPELPSSYFLRATCYDHLRRFAEAVENYKAFLASSNGQFPDDEWKARHRLVAIEPEAKRKK